MIVAIDRTLRQLLSLTTGVVVFALLSTLQFSVAWSQGPTEATVHIDRAVVAYDEKRFDAALKELLEALRLEPENVEALYYQGIVYLTLNRPAEAQGALEKARALRPTNTDISFQLGVLYFSQQDYEKADPLLRQVYQVEPSRPNLGYYLGFIEYRKKNYREAITLLQANNPSDDSFAQLTRFYSGLAMSALGFPQQAQVEISEALRLQPISPLTTPAQRFGEILQSAAQRERFFRGELRLGIFYDTNVPVIPSTSSDIVVQAINEQQRRRKSEGELASVNLSYTWLKALDWEGTASYRFFQTYNNRLTEFNTQDHTPTASIAYQGKIAQMPVIAGSQFAYDFITLGNRKFSQRWIFNPYMTLVESQTAEFQNSTTLQLRFQAKDFFHDSDVIQPSPVGRSEVRDALNYMLGPLQFLVLDGGPSRTEGQPPRRHYLKLGYQYDSEHAEGKNWSYRGHRALAGGQYALPWWDVRLRYDLDFHWRFHENKHSLIPATAPGTRKRKDQQYIHFVTVAKEFVPSFLASLPFCRGERLFPMDPLRGCSVGVGVEYLFDNNKSNLDPFAYKRHVVTTSLTWRF